MKKISQVIFLTLFLVSCAPPKEPWPIPISYYEDPDLISEGLYLFPSDGSSPTMILNLPKTRIYSRPTYSPDGRYLAFLHNNGYDSDDGLFLLDMTQENLEAQQLTEFGSHYLSWSPDGNQILLYDFGDGTGTDQVDYLGIYDLNSGNLQTTTIPEKRSSDWIASWSPDGTKITYITHETLDTEALYVYDVATDQSTIIQSFTARQYAYTPFWGIDNRIYLAVGDTQHYPGLRSIDPDNPSSLTATNLIDNVYDMALSPNKQFLAVFQEADPSLASVAINKFWLFLFQNNPVEQEFVEDFLYRQFERTTPKTQPTVFIVDLATGQKHRHTFFPSDANLQYYELYWKYDSSALALILWNGSDHLETTITIYDTP